MSLSLTNAQREQIPPRPPFVLQKEASLVSSFFRFTGKNVLNLEWIRNQPCRNVYEVAMVVRNRPHVSLSSTISRFKGKALESTAPLSV